MIDCDIHFAVYVLALCICNGYEINYFKHIHTLISDRDIQGWQKLPTTGQAKPNPSTIQSNARVADKFIAADILFLSVVS